MIMKKILIIAVLAVIVTAGLYLYDMIVQDPNFILRKTSTEISEGEAVPVTYSSDRRTVSGRLKIPVFCFTPDESTEYTFTVSDIESENGVFLVLNVMDLNMTDFIFAENHDDPEKEITDTIFLTEGKKSIIYVEAISDSWTEQFSGKFTVTVTKAAKESGPAEITVGGSAKIKVGAEEQSAVLFRPEETGYYRFGSDLAAKYRKTGSSDITSIISADNKEIKAAEGICRLESGQDYYVWVSVYDIEDISADVTVHVTKADSITANGFGTYSISGNTIIELDADESRAVAVYSLSDGDMSATVYDSKGFPVSSDDGSGEAISGHKGDFALVLKTMKGQKYMIYANGRFNECRIIITGYTGDGTSLGPDDIEPLNEENGSEL